MSGGDQPSVIGRIKPSRKLALTRLEPALGLVDHINPALAADEAVVAMATAQGLQRITDFHGLKPSRAAVTRAIIRLLELRRNILIDRPPRQLQA